MIFLIFLWTQNFPKKNFDIPEHFPDASQDRITFTLRPARVQISIRQSPAHDDGYGKTNNCIGLWLPAPWPDPGKILSSVRTRMYTSGRCFTKEVQPVAGWRADHVHPVRSKTTPGHSDYRRRNTHFPKKVTMRSGQPRDTRIRLSPSTFPKGCTKGTKKTCFWGCILSIFAHPGLNIRYLKIIGR